MYNGEAPDACGSLDARRGSEFDSEDMVSRADERTALGFKEFRTSPLRAEDRLYEWYLSIAL